MKFKISVITPSLNNDKYIEQAINSVLCQNYDNFEHIIIDGGSTDNTLQIIKKYSHLIWLSEPDNGQSHAMNKGFSYSTGDVIVYLNTDDYFEPDAFNIVNNYLKIDNNVKFVVGGCNIVGIDGQKLEYSDRYYKNVHVDFESMLAWWKYPFPINPSSYFYFREVQEQVGPFNESMHYTLDYDFLLRVAKKYKILKIYEVLGNYRYIPGTKTYESHQSDHWRSTVLFTNGYRKFLPYHKQVKLELSYRIWTFEILLKKLLRPIYNRVKGKF